MIDEQKESISKMSKENERLVEENKRLVEEKLTVIDEFDSNLVINKNNFTHEGASYIYEDIIMKLSNRLYKDFVNSDNKVFINGVEISDDIDKIIASIIDTGLEGHQEDHTMDNGTIIRGDIILEVNGSKFKLNEHTTEEILDFSYQNLHPVIDGSQFLYGYFYISENIKIAYTSVSKNNDAFGYIILFE